MSTGAALTSGGARLRASVLARFASVGVVNTLVDLGLYVGLVLAGVPTLAANVVSTSAGMAVSFAGNRRFVFGSTGNRAREVTLFLLVCGLGIWAVQPAVIVAVTSLLTGRVDVPAVVLAAAPKVVAIGTAAVWNYVLYSRVVFRGGPHDRKERGSR